MQAERSLSQLTNDLAAQVSELFRNEVRLARAETAESIRGMSDGIVRTALGVALAAAAVTLGLFGVAYALGETMPMWAGAFLSAGVGGIGAYALIKSGLKALKAENLALPRTAKQVQRDIHLFKEKLS